MRLLYCSTLLALSSAALLLPSAFAETADLAALQQDAKQRISHFSGELKTALREAIQQGGLINGVQVCQEQAPIIAQKWSTDGWSIGRTSLKVRNSENAASEWQQAELERYAEQLKNGAEPSSLSYAKIINADNGGQSRYMQPIIMDSLCLACHGSNIDSQLQQAITQHYPTDLATGFSLGELRGAFVLEKQL